MVYSIVNALHRFATRVLIDLLNVYAPVTARILAAYLVTVMENAL